jgi:hypothetical protein
VIVAELSAGEKAAVSTVERWVRHSRSSTATQKLSDLVMDPESWRPPRGRLRPRGGTAAWYRLCLLREYIARRGGLSGLAELLRYIETKGDDGDLLLVQAAAKLVADYIMVGVRMRSIRYAREYPANAAAALQLVPKASNTPLPRKLVAAR